MPRSSGSGLGVSNWYGSRDTGGFEGSYRTAGLTREYVFDFTGRTLADGDYSKVVIPAGAAVIKAEIFVDEAFDLQAASVLEVGTKGSEATNGVSITEAELEAEGRVDLTSALAGTWDAEARFAADTEIGFAFSAGGLTANSGQYVGKARVIFTVNDI